MFYFSHLADYYYNIIWYNAFAMYKNDIISQRNIVYHHSSTQKNEKNNLEEMPEHADSV